MQQILSGCPLSPQQKRLLASQAGQVSRPARLVLQLDGSLDTGRLRQALERVVARHEILRTRFQRQPGMKFPFQVITENTNLGWTTTDVSSLEPNCRDIRISEFRSPGSLTALDQLPAVSAALWKLSPSKYCLTLSISPLCIDSASLHRLVFELGSFYACPDQTLGDAIQYADYSQWRNDLLKNEDEQNRKAKSFWSSPRFSSTPTLLLPYQGKRSGDGASVRTLSITIAADAQQKLESVAGGDIATFLLACWAALLSRLSGQSELFLSYLNAASLAEDLRGSVGLFATSLPLYCSIDVRGSVPSLATSLHLQISEMLEHSDYFENETSTADPKFGFVVESQGEAFQVGDVHFSVTASECPPEPLCARLRCKIGEGCWVVSFDYNPRVFADDAAQILVKHFENLLQSIAKQPQEAIGSLEILDESERQTILASFNQTADATPQLETIHQAFEKQVALTPGRPALRFGEQEFTYAELDQCANRVAHYLKTHGVQANVAVGLCMERSAEMIIGLLGILKSGGCYVPLAPDNPQARLAHQLEETGAPLLVTQERLLGQLPPFSGTILCLDRDASVLTQEPSSRPDNPTHSDDLAYVIYTSGSTGVPKGVAVRHRNLVNYTAFMCRRLDLDNAGRGLHFATVSTISADLGNTCIFPAIISGGCLHVIDYEVAMSANLLADYMAKYPIDVLKITPSHLASLLAASEDNRILPLTCLILGGEVTRWELANRIMQSSECRLLNHYGPTEATVGCCTFDVRAEIVSSWNPTTVPLGHPIANTQIFILDERMQPVPLGVSGEIYIGGAGVAQGYLNQAQQTAERFVAHPFSQDASARLYRTGDLARFLPNGSVEFLGRIDHQVKIRGFRVEPVEIEAVLKEHSAIRQVFISTYEENPGDRRLAAYVVTSAAVENDELKSFVAGHLPDYMVPTIVQIENLPLTANGKVDTRALPSPNCARGTVRSEAEPTNATEQAVADIWTQVLGLKRVGIHDNFFDLGGHSLIATQIIARIRNHFRVQLPLHGFLETPTVAGLAAKIAQCPAAETEDEQLAKLLAEIEGIPDSGAQEL